MNIFVHLLDKIINRLITAYLARAEEKNLPPHKLLLERAQEEAADYATRHARGIVPIGSFS